MKLSLPLTAAICLTTLLCAAQTTPSKPPASETNPSKGQVIFSRSTDANGETTTQTGPAATQHATQTAAASPADDTERQAVTFTAFDLDVHLRPAAQHIAVRALITVRNDGKTPLALIPMQISSALNWESIRANAKDVAFQVATVNSDADHTGQLHEAAISLVQPLLPGQSLQFDATYSGVIALSAQRLLSIGAPEGVAMHSDWDQISLPFTGLRGFGNVVWYPASSVPVMMGDGARLFDEMGSHKLRLTGAHFRLRLAVEFPHGQAPSVALINGQSVPLAVTESGALDQSQEVDGVATADFGNTTLGFEAPSLFVAMRKPHPGPNLTAWALPEDNVAVEFWTTAAQAVTPFLKSWLGEKPRRQLTLLDLPDAEDAPFETGALLAAPLREPGPKAVPGALDGVLVHALAHAWILPPNSSQPLPAWLNEGVARFMGTLWVERRQGRDAALRMLEADRAALALAEPASPGESAGQPLTEAISPVYYRTKAAYVLWMLRDLAGDPALSAALQAYQPTVGIAAPAAGKPAARSAFEKLLEESEDHPDLAWFFADWVDADKGLPDLSIEAVFPTSASAGNWLVAINVANKGYVQADVPITVRSASTSVTHRVRIAAQDKVTERILIQGSPTEVQVNDGTAPETQASVHMSKIDEPAANPANSSQPRPPQQ
jgi:hypothetical protein